MWFEEPMGTDEVAFEADVFLLRKATAATLKAGKGLPGTSPEPAPGPTSLPPAEPIPSGPATRPTESTRTLRLTGTVPPEVWNRLGTKILPKLRSGSELKIGVEFSVTVPTDAASALTTELRQILQDLGLADAVRVE
jgi:hypothetical protein